MTEDKMSGILTEGDEYERQFREESKHNPLIPDLSKTRVEESSIPGLAGMFLPVELLKLAEYAYAGDMNGVVWMLFAFIFTVMVAMLLPLRIRMMELTRLGTPTIEMTMLGKFMWTEQYRIIDIIPAALPDQPLNIDELLAHPTDEQLDKWGIEIDDKYLRTLIDTYRQYRSGRGYRRYLGGLRAQWQSIRRYVIAGVVITVLLYVFWPVVSHLIWRLNQFILEHIS